MTMMKDVQLKLNEWQAALLQLKVMILYMEYVEHLYARASLYVRQELACKTSKIYF